VINDETYIIQETAPRRRRKMIMIRKTAQPDMFAVLLVDAAR